VLNTDLHRAFRQGEMRPEHIESLLDSVKWAGINLEIESLEYVLRKNLENIAKSLSATAMEIDSLKRLNGMLDLALSLPFRVNLWSVQNTCYDLLQHTFPDMRRRAEKGDKGATESVAHFAALCEKLSVRITPA